MAFVSTPLEFFIVKLLSANIEFSLLSLRVKTKDVLGVPYKYISLISPCSFSVSLPNNIFF